MWIWVVAALLAYYVKGLCGFANTLVFTSVLGFSTNNIDISPVDLLIGYPTNIILAWKYRKNIDLKICVPLAISVLIGCIPGAIFLKNFNATVLKILFGFVVVLLGIEMFLRDYYSKKSSNSKLIFIATGILSGLLTGLFGVGALLAACVGRMTTTSEEFKANITAVFIVESTFRIILYSVIGVITLSSLKKALILFPFMLAGLFLGIHSSQRLDEKKVKKIINLLLIISGLILIIRNLV